MTNRHLYPTSLTTGWPRLSRELWLEGAAATEARRARRNHPPIGLSNPICKTLRLESRENQARRRLRNRNKLMRICSYTLRI